MEFGQVTFYERKALNKRRVILNTFVSFLPQLCIFFMLVYITKNILSGKGTIGDYSLYSGMFSTLSTNTFIFISSAIEVYENKLKMENIRKFQKYESKIEDNGVELSGGQRQKIALSRAFYGKGDIVILDEPSAALDPEAEYKIFERMKELCRNKTAIRRIHVKQRFYIDIRCLLSGCLLISR